MQLRLKLSFFDLLIILIIVIIAILLLLFTFSNNHETLYATVFLDGKEVNKILLTNIEEPIELQYSNLGYTNTIVAENGRICVLSADCPHQDCVRQGWLSHKGQIAVCLKSRLMIRVDGQNDNYDTVVG